jgi:Holliday junction DNA helicase, RuvA subunit
MIGRLTGILQEKQPPDLLIDVQGVGYDVQVSMNTFFALPGLGESVTLHTHFVVREDAQQLFGFVSQEERKLFRSLVKVNGVGPKMALGILSGMSVGDFVRCVRAGDSASLTKVPGVGAKTASRLLVEMKDGLEKWQTTESSPDFSAQVTSQRRDPLEEAESALIALGYKPQEAAKMLARAGSELEESDRTSENLIRAALKSMVR